MEAVAKAMEAAGKAQLVAGRASIDAAAAIRGSAVPPTEPPIAPPTKEIDLVLDIEPINSVVTIVNGKLAVNGVIVKETNRVIALGQADGYDLVHLNDSRQWWGRKAGLWAELRSSDVTTDYVPPVVPPLNPAPVVGDLPPYVESFPEGDVKFQLLSPADEPIAVKPEFFGTHMDLSTLGWQDPEKLNRVFPVPSPTYPYGNVRTLRAIVDGMSERFYWRNIEVAPNEYDWHHTDKWMEANAGHGVLFLIYGPPAFYQKYPGENSRWPSWPGIASPPKDEHYAAMKRYAQAAKARYGDQIIGFEVWNEPSLPWTGGPADYTSRMSPEWINKNFPGKPAFFSGSGSDLANIAFTLNTADLGVPIYGCAFVDMWEAGSYTLPQFLNAPVTLSGGEGTTGKDHVQKLSVHVYDYSHNPTCVLTHLDGYIDHARKNGVGHLPIVISEIGAEDGGVFHDNDPRAVTAIFRWAAFAAAKRCEEMYLYGHLGGRNGVSMVGGIHNPSIIEAVTKAYGLGGMILRKVVVMKGGRVWLHGYKNGELIAIEG